ncbi:uncharacterized protein LOC134203760 [Armigeres subalbatus]|uniref:uncharacterized protein LOC134203760 n=1 Tax=Armigeres subalbatus TaxID=124917 RepID=UPI002ED14959
MRKEWRGFSSADGAEIINGHLLLPFEKRLLNSLVLVEKFVQDFDEERDKKEVEVRLQLLETCVSEFFVVRDKVEVLLDEAADEATANSDGPEKACKVRLESESRKREEDNLAIATDVENRFCKAKAALVDRRVRKPPGSSSSVLATGTSISRVKLPEIKLPTFDGRLRYWVSYRDAFRSLIHANRDLTDMDRFTYLRSSLTGDALQEISSVELSAANYPVAWTALEDRYHNQKLIVKAYLDAIFRIEPMRKESFEALSQLISDFEKNLQMLQKMGQNTNGWSTILVHMVCSRLDGVTLRFWESSHNSKEVHVYRNLINFRKNHCALLQLVGSSNFDLKKPKLSVSHSSTSIGRCRCAFMKLKISERYDAVRRNGLCMNCLSSGHFAQNCSKEMNSAQVNTTNRHSIRNRNHQHTRKHQPQTTPNLPLHCQLSIHIRIAPTHSSMFARALLDSCLQYCFILSEFCRRMKLEEFPNYLPVKGIGNTGSVSKKAVSGTISPRFDSISEFEEVMRFNVLPKLTIPLPCEGFETCQWNLPESIVLGDPEFYHISDIDMIFGAEYYLDLLQEGRFRLITPYLVISVPATSTALCFMFDLREQLTRFWDLESCHLARTYSVEESTCEELFKKTTTSDVDGRFIVNLHRKVHVIGHLGSSRAMAERRFLSLERRLSINPQLKKLYCEFMQEYVTMGHMEKIRKEDISGAAHYFLPHYAVLKPDSTITKLRVVFDTSCKTSSGLSLNDGLVVGPVGQYDQISIHA